MKTRKLVQLPEDVPQGSHFVLLKMSRGTTYSPSYDRDNEFDSTQSTTISMYTFLDEGEWRKDCEEAALAMHKGGYSQQDQYVAYHVDKVASLKVTPVVEIRL